MEKSKNWIKDRVNAFSFEKGDTVILVRKKQNGHPKKLVLGVEYTVEKVENDSLFVVDETNKQKKWGTQVMIKCHYSYFIKLNSYREEVIRQIIGD